MVEIDGLLAEFGGEISDAALVLEGLAQPFAMAHWRGPCCPR